MLAPGMLRRDTQTKGFPHPETSSRKHVRDSSGTGQNVIPSEGNRGTGQDPAVSRTCVMGAGSQCIPEAVVDKGGALPGAGACFPEHRPVVSFLHPVGRQTNPWRGLIPAAARPHPAGKATYPVLFGSWFYFGGVGGCACSLCHSQPLGNIFGAKFPGALAAHGLFLPFPPGMCQPCAGCFPFLGWVPTSTGAAAGVGGSIQDPNWSAQTRLSCPEPFSHANPNGSDIPCWKLPPNTPSSLSSPIWELLSRPPWGSPRAVAPPPPV